MISLREVLEARPTYFDGFPEASLQSFSEWSLAKHLPVSFSSLDPAFTGQVVHGVFSFFVYSVFPSIRVALNAKQMRPRSDSVIGVLMVFSMDSLL